MLRSLGAILPVLALWAVCFSSAGCGAAASGRTIMRHESGEATAILPAPDDGQYALYEGTAATAKITVDVKKGDDLGWRQADQPKKVTAVWGKGAEKSMLVNEGRYYWKLLSKSWFGK